MAFDPWAGTNQGISNIGNTMMSLAQLKRQDEEQAKKNRLVDLQTQAAEQQVNDQTTLRTALASAQGGFTYPEPQGVGPFQQGASGLSALGPQARPANAEDRLAVMADLASQGNSAAMELYGKTESLNEKLAQHKAQAEAYGDAEGAAKAEIVLKKMDASGKALENWMKVDPSGELARQQIAANPDLFNGMDPSKMKIGKTQEEPPAYFPAPDGGFTFYDGKEWKHVTKPKENEIETWGDPYQANVGGKRAMMQKSNRGQVRSVLADNSTTVKINTGGGKPTGIVGTGHGGLNVKMNGLSPEQTAALSSAIAEGRLDPYKINSKNQQILADTAIQNPGINLNDTAANLSLARNKDVQMKGAIAETVPPLLKSIVENGKKLNYSDNQYIGEFQQWINKKSNNPQFVKYMSLRNDQLLTLGGIMRSNGMTDMAQRLEEEAARPTMSPRALAGWLDGQMESVNPRLTMYRSIREGKGAPRPNAQKPKEYKAAEIGSFVKDQYSSYKSSGLSEEAAQSRIYNKMKKQGWSDKQIAAAWAAKGK